MPRLVVPMALLPRSPQRVELHVMRQHDVRAIGDGEALRASASYASRSRSISPSSTSGSITVPWPSTMRDDVCSTPEGIKRSTVFLPSTTSVWPAFAPPA